MNKLSSWFYQRRINNIFQNINLQPIELNEPLVFSESEVYTISNSTKLITPHIFEGYNRILDFHLELRLFGSNSYSKAIQKNLSSIHNILDCGDQSINYKWIQGITNTKSDLPENYGKWKNFYQFGKYAYEIHLASYRNLETDLDWEEHYSDLIKFFEKLQKTKHGIYSFRYQSWCDRYYIVNSGVARRVAACSYFAKKGDINFDKLIVFPVKKETIEWGVIKKLEETADSYAIFASDSFHESFKKLIIETGSPIAICTTPTNRGCYQHKSVILYLLLNDDFISQYVKDDDYCEAYIYQRRSIKTKLDEMKRKGQSISLTNYVKLIINVWQSENNEVRNSKDRVFTKEKLAN